MSLTQQERELLRRVDEVLHYIWDPIGVAGVPQARDEYEGYAPKVLELLKGTVDGKDVASYLTWVSTDRMGLSPNASADASVVEVLLAWKHHLL